MQDDPRLLELLVEWEQREEAKESVRLEDLCANQPELLEPLRRRVRALRAMRGVLDVTAYREPEEGVAEALPLSSPPGYQIVQLLGRGGMGVVYKARQEGLDRIVALKMILGAEHADPKTLARFETEAKMVARLKHPNIVQVYEIGTHQGRPFIVLEYLAGGNLATLLEDYSLSPTEAARLVEALARAVHHAHQQGVVHRDLKPGNILFTQVTPGPDGRPLLGEPKVVDFGLARQLDRDKRLTATGAVLGTPCYMAPEQASGKIELLGPSVDIYSLGVILFECVTGRLPFDGTTEWEVIQAVISKEPDSPSRIKPECPAGLEAICLRCLRKKPSERYATALDLAEDLRRFLAGQTPRTATLKVHSSIKRRERWRWLVALGAVLLGAAGLWAFMALWARHQPPWKLGVMVPLRGDLSANGQACLDAIHLAAEEINAEAGPFGRRIEIVTGEDFSDERADVVAEQLITRDRVSCLLGTWSSTGRKAVLPVLAQHNHVLITPAESAGLEQSPHVVYLGTVPNQTVLPALDWFYKEYQDGQRRGCRKMFLVGSDEYFDHAVNAIVRDYLKQWPDTSIVGEEYVNFEDGMVPLTQKIRDANPDLVINTMSGDLNIALFSFLRSARSGLWHVPVLSIDCTERDLMSLRAQQLPGCYLVGSYFECLDTPASKRFVKSFKDWYGSHRVAFDVMETAYCGVHLWARAVRSAGSDDPAALRKAILRQKYEAPEGLIRFNEETGHAIRFGRVAGYAKGADGSVPLRIVWNSPGPIEPEIFPGTRSKQSWLQFVDELYVGWGNHWTQQR
jgi:urea transport system substrate-binding protein